MTEFGTTFTEASSEQRSKWWRSVLGEYPTGVTIVSALDENGHPQGLVVGTFSAVSMEPPLISFAPMRTSRAYTAIAECTNFRVNVLGAGHEELCRSFASAPPDKRFEIGNWELDDNGIPHLADSIVWLDCVRSQTIPAGDHDIVIGEVRNLGFGSGIVGMPMLFLKGGYGSFTVPHLEFNVDHLASHLRLADRMRDVISDLAEELDATISLCSLAQDHVVVLGASNLQAEISRPEAVGSTFPFAAPLGVVFAAWGKESRISMWRRVGHDLGFTDDESATRLLEQVRERGYAVSLGPAMAERFNRITSSPAKGTEEIGELWAAVTRDYKALSGRLDWASHVSSIQVPIFGPAGEADLALVVVGLRASEYAEIERIADRCKSVASDLMTMIDGVPPSGE